MLVCMRVQRDARTIMQDVFLRFCVLYGITSFLASRCSAQLYTGWWHMAGLRLSLDCRRSGPTYLTSA